MIITWAMAAAPTLAFCVSATVFTCIVAALAGAVGIVVDWLMGEDTVL